MKNRYFFIDNQRWVVVVLVLIYHVFYNFNAVGVIGGIGGFAPEQWQDVVCTALNQIGRASCRERVSVAV